MSHLHERIARPGQCQMGLLMIDLDRFRDVNDSYGRDVLDELLLQVNARLEDLLGPNFLARLGGDEFAVLTERFDSEIALARLAEEEIGILSDTWQLGDETEVRLGASVGIACYLYFGHTPKGVLQQADAAFYRAKAEGRCGFRLLRLLVIAEGAKPTRVVSSAPVSTRSLRVPADRATLLRSRIQPPGDGRRGAGA
ncbi:MAG: diguanylate cyclase domain-containing protein [Pseudomonadota bacterium]